jgi:hypothetical protein
VGRIVIVADFVSLNSYYLKKKKKKNMFSNRTV